MDVVASPMAAASSSSSSSSSSRGLYGSPSVAARPGVLASGRPEIVCFGSRFRFSGRFLEHRLKSFSTPREMRRHVRRSAHVRASSSSSSSGSLEDPSPAQIAPLQLESATGQFLSQILASHPHLLSAAVDQQLQQLQTESDAEKQKEPTDPGTDILLFKRISEVRANERRRAVEEILYTLIIQKFMDADVSLIAGLSQSADPSRRVDQWPPQEEELRKLHSPEAYEMIQNHLSLILGNRLGGADSVAPLSKFRVGQLYAASVMYGYFLKRVDQRFQLEKTMQTLPFASEQEEEVKSYGDHERQHPEVNLGGGFGYGIKPTRLRSYVMSFDPETLQRWAAVRSKEALGLVERQTEALFGKSTAVITPRGTIDPSKDELIKISVAGLRRLIMEAVTFGSSLLEMESYVDSRHRLAPNF